MPSQSPRKNKSSRPFLSFLKTSPCKPSLAQGQGKELPLLPLESPFKDIGPPRSPPQVPCPPCPRSNGLKDEVDTPDYLFHPMKLISPISNPSPVSMNVRLESPLSAAVDVIGTPDNLFPPLRYGSPSDSPTQRPPLLKRPLYPPPSNDTSSPDNIFPQLRFGSPSSPGGIHHAAYIRNNNNSNNPSRLRSATLQSPIKGSYTTPQRLRSATVESSNTFGTPKVIARDYASPATTRLPAVQVQTTCPTTSPKHRRRPSKLTLRTTNLLELQPGETTPTPQNLSSSTTAPCLTPIENPYPASATTKRTRNAGERRRSRSTGDLEGLLLRQGNHRASRSESHKLAAFPVEVGGSDTETREVYTPASVLSVTSIVSDATISPDKPIGSRFDNVPLPWSTQPLSSLLPTLPVDYLTNGQEELLLRIPHILAPHTLLSLSSEEDRLQLELERLKVKHTTLSQRRDKLISRLGLQHRSGNITSGLQAVQEVVARVDRVGRQIYICNDQVRQMGVMKRDHEIGVLLWALDQARVEKEKMEVKAFIRVEEERMVVQVPDIQLTRATLYEDNTREDDGYEVLNSPAVEQEEESYAEILSEKERPMSTISIASGRFGFPIPPSRPSVIPPALSPKSESQGHEFDDAEKECDYDSSFGHEPDYQAVNRNFLLPYNITIYPPTEGLTGTQTYPSSPHTPQGSTESHSARGHDRLPLPLNKRSTPLSARRSKPDLTIPIPRRPSSRRPPPRQTSPLRLAAPKLKSKTRSLQSDMVVSSQEKFLRARESRLEDAEAIMLSLATAELWTKGMQSPGV